MVQQFKMWEWSGFIGTWNAGVDLVKCIFLPCGTVYIFKNLGMADFKLARLSIAATTSLSGCADI